MKNESDQQTPGLLPISMKRGALIPGCFMRFKQQEASLTILLQSQMVSVDQMTRKGWEWSFPKGNGCALEC